MTDENKTEQAEQKPESTLNLVERVEAAAARIEKANAEAKVTEGKLQELRANEILAGVTDAGQKTPEKKEMTPKEYAEAVSKGQIPGQ